MIKKELTPGVIQYMFPPRRVELGYNIVAVIDGNRAVLIDAAYEVEAQQVFEDLSANGIIIEKIVISHFHSDHFFGLHVLPSVPFYGGMHYKETLIFEGATEEEINKYTPTFIVDKPMTLEFGSHLLELIPFLGHALCTLLVKINEQLLFIGDELIFLNTGQQTLPYLCDSRKDIRRQLEALDKLKEYSELIIIPAKGPAFEGSGLHKHIQNLMVYLNAVLETNGVITYEEAVKNCSYPLLQSHWHEHNCK